MKKQIQQTPTDPLEQMMSAVVEGFKHTAGAIQDLRNQQAALGQRQEQQARAAYQGMTGSGKSRYAAALVAIENEVNPRGAQTRAAATLGITPGRMSQLLSSEKNRNNGK